MEVLNFNILLCQIVTGSRPEHGVPDMTMLSDIDEEGINRNLHVRYDRDQIYVSFSFSAYYTTKAGAKLMKSRLMGEEAAAEGSHEPRQEEIDGDQFPRMHTTGL